MALATIIVSWSSPGAGGPSGPRASAVAWGHLGERLGRGPVPVVGIPLFPLFPGTTTRRTRSAPIPLRQRVVLLRPSIWAAAQRLRRGLGGARGRRRGRWSPSPSVGASAGPRRRAAGRGRWAAWPSCSCSPSRFSGFAAIEIDRFEGPSTLACGLLVLYALWPLRRPGAVRTRPRAPDGGQAPHSARASVDAGGARGWSPPSCSWRSCCSRSTSGGTLGVVRRTNTNHLHRDRRPAGPERLPRPLRRLQAEYAQLNAAVPRGAKVLVGGRLPHLARASRSTVRHAGPGRQRVAPAAHALLHRRVGQGGLPAGLGFDYIVRRLQSSSAACTSSRRVATTTSTRHATTTGPGPRTSSTG